MSRVAGRLALRSRPLVVRFFWPQGSLDSLWQYSVAVRAGLVTGLRIAAHHAKTLGYAFARFPLLAVNSLTANRGAPPPDCIARIDGGGGGESQESCGAFRFGSVGGRIGGRFIEAFPNRLRILRLIWFGPETVETGDVPRLARRPEKKKNCESLRLPRRSC